MAAVPVLSAYAYQKLSSSVLANMPLPVRTALLAGFALASEDPATAVQAMWATTSGMHRAHFCYVLTDMPGGHRFRPLIGA